MAFRICEDVGTTKRSKMTPTKALRIFEAHKGICVLSGQKIGPADDWYIEHIRALELGGSDDESNMGPALYAFKRQKDAADHSAAARAKRIKRRHLGIKTRKGPPMIGSRDSGWKRRMDGTLVRRSK